MFKSKTLSLILIVLVVLTLILVGVYFFLIHKSKPTTSKEPTITQVANQLSVDTDEITTNLKDNKFIKIKFKIEVSSKAAKKELEERQFQVNNSILYILSNKTEQDLEGQKGLETLEGDLKQSLNKLMKDGTIVHVYTTEKLIQ